MSMLDAKFRRTFGESLCMRKAVHTDYRPARYRIKPDPSHPTHPFRVIDTEPCLNDEIAEYSTLERAQYAIDTGDWNLLTFDYDKEARHAVR